MSRPTVSQLRPVPPDEQALPAQAPTPRNPVCVEAVFEPKSMSSRAYPPQEAIRAAVERRSGKENPYIVIFGKLNSELDSDYRVYVLPTNRTLDELLNAPLFRERENEQETSIEFFERIYGSKEFLQSRKFYCHYLLAKDPQLYRNIAVHQTRHGMTLRDLIPFDPVATGRPRMFDGLSDAELAQEMRKRVQLNRDRERERYRQRRAGLQPS